MKRILISICTIFLALILFSSTSFPWGSATHAYIADHIGKRFGLRNLNEMYGSMAPDLFNLMYEESYRDYREYLFWQTHGTTEDESFMEVWYLARWWGYERSLAYGFVCHNKVWGADYLADTGYVMAKAEELEIELSEVWESLGLEDPIFALLRLQICENLVETGIDILITQKYPFIVLKMISSALFRSSNFPGLLVRAYAADFYEYFKNEIDYEEAVNIITIKENEFRELMILYGTALSKDKETAIGLLSEQFAALAEDAYGIIVPPWILTPLIIESLSKAIDICEDDYEAAINDTIRTLKWRLWSHWIFYW